MLLDYIETHKCVDLGVYAFDCFFVNYLLNIELNVH